MAISASSREARSSRLAAVRGDGLAALLDLAGQHADELVLGQLAELLLLEVVRGAGGHAQHVAAQHITRPHGGGRVVVDPLSKGHRFWHLGR